MSKLVIESTNGGSRAMVCGGQTIIDEKADEVVMPPKAVRKAEVSDRDDEDFMAISLILNKTADKDR